MGDHTADTGESRTNNEVLTAVASIGTSNYNIVRDEPEKLKTQTRGV